MSPGGSLQTAVVHVADLCTSLCLKVDLIHERKTADHSVVKSIDPGHDRVVENIHRHEVRVVSAGQCKAHDDDGQLDHRCQHLVHALLFQTGANRFICPLALRN